MLIQPNHAYSCLGYKKVFNVLASRIGQKASWPIMRNMETFSSKQMFCWINSFSSLIGEHCWCPLIEDCTCRCGERGLLGNTQCLLCKSSKTFDQFNKNILIVSNPRSSSYKIFVAFANCKSTRSSWLNCALRGDEVVYWVNIGQQWLVLSQYEAVPVGIWCDWVRRKHLCLYILRKVEIWSGVTDASQTHSLTDFER